MSITEHTPALPTMFSLVHHTSSARNEATNFLLIKKTFLSQPRIDADLHGLNEPRGSGVFIPKSKIERSADYADWRRLKDRELETVNFYV